MSSEFQNVPNWKHAWKVVRQIESGGQGHGYQVRSTTDDRVAFLKILKDQKSLERRRRFYREAAAYDSLSCPGIPNLILSNCQLHEDQSIDLFLITEFVEGPTFGDDGLVPRTLKSAVDLTVQLLSILEYLHSNGFVHRDIKPENIILIENEHRPVVLDLGLAFKEDDPSHDTETGQELGNRFLRLPELSAGSKAKQDPSSDVSFAVGVLFFLITGIIPYTLRDESGKLPHQRDTAKAFFDRSNRDHKIILGIFDRAFSYEIGTRFRTAAELMDELNRLGEIEVNEETEIQEFRRTFITPQAKIDSERMNALQIAMNCASHANARLATEFSPRFVNQQSNAKRQPGVMSNELGFAYGYDYTVAERGTIRAQIVGTEIVVSFDEDQLYRSKFDEIDAAELEDIFSKRFLKLAMHFDSRLKEEGR